MTLLENKIFYMGIKRNLPLIWFDSGKWFSIDVAHWFVRLYIHITDLWFCRYFGIIAKEE